MATRLSFDAWNLSVKWLSGDYLYQSVWRYRMATESVITPWPFFSSWCRVLTKFLILLHCIREWLRVLCLQIHTIRSCESWWCQNFQHFLSWACFLILEVVYVGDWNCLSVCMFKQGLRWFNIHLRPFFMLFPAVRHWRAFGEILYVDLVYCPLVAVDRCWSQLYASPGDELNMAKDCWRSLWSPCSVIDTSAHRKECNSSLVMFTSAISLLLSDECPWYLQKPFILVWRE